MKICVLCGTKYHADESWETPCDNCKDEKNFDTTQGSMHWKVLGALDKLLNGNLIEEELKLIADSHGFPWLCERALPLMEHRQLVNLLKRIAGIVKRTEENDGGQ